MTNVRATLLFASLPTSLGVTLGEGIPTLPSDQAALRLLSLVAMQLTQTVPYEPAGAFDCSEAAASTHSLTFAHATVGNTRPVIGGTFLVFSSAISPDGCFAAVTNRGG